ncbi:GNAT family N-acetyltransferase [Pseudooceanicola aestuarii]|uniref:GNAT family N-acetyltransferase n=1 Tax=Pseudooceanicola aestuarii TaxID=2697319 RepID=UPI001EF8B544|nr:GNAT family N-acetyltransferase [Pseudooceanicola aestuarii]
MTDARADKPDHPEGAAPPSSALSPNQVAPSGPAASPSPPAAPVPSPALDNLTLRPARTTDAGAVGAILSDYTDHTPWLPRLHSRAEDIAHAGLLIDRGWTRLALVDDVIRGFLAREGAQIHALYVARGWRGAGIGARLLRGAMAECARLDLWTFVANDAAQRFYRRHGFAEARRTAGENDEGLPDILFSWRSARETAHG